MIRTQPSHRCARSNAQPQPVPGLSSWNTIQEAVAERLEAVELFLADLSARYCFRSEVPADDPAQQLLEQVRVSMTGRMPGFRKRIWLAAIDLACDTSGQFWFVDDHYCCPYGLFKLQKLLDDASCDDEPLNEWNAFTDAAAQSLFADVDPQHAAVLGASTFNPAYSENRFFAEWLGLPYVHNRQLTVQDGELRRQNSTAARRIHLILRRLQDDDLDPFHFRAGSLQGVPGLVRAHRSTRVSVVNSPGTGIFNSRHVSRLIPDMVRFYLGREPLLPTVRTRPAPQQISQLRKELDGVILRTGSSMDLLKPLIGRTCTNSSRDRYLQLMAVEPNRFVVRDRIDRTTNAASASFSLRVFCVGKTDRQLLRGGLLRECRPDGTPAGRITSDETAQVLRIGSTPRTPARRR